MEHIYLCSNAQSYDYENTLTQFINRIPNHFPLNHYRSVRYYLKNYLKKINNHNLLCFFQTSQVMAS